MLKNFFRRVRDILLHPQTFFRKARREQTLKPMLMFYLGLVIFYIVVSAPLDVMTILNFQPLFTMFGAFGPVLLVIFGIIFFAATMLLSAFISLFIFTAILHSGIFLMKGKGNIRETLKLYGYAQTPMLVLGVLIRYMSINQMIAVFALVPAVVILVWTIVTVVAGIMELHRLSIGKSILALLISAGIVVLITAVAVLLLLYIGFYAGATPVPPFM